jgi:subtilisin-like proprotein convertase family protein/polyhydroxyalkanoate synthesis regulator phasin
MITNRHDRGCAFLWRSFPMFSSRQFLAAVSAALLGAVAALGQTYSNTAPITIPSLGTATPYPSVIVASGAPTSINYITVSILGFGHTFPGDVQVVLVSPGGQRFMLMGGVGSGADVSGVNLTFAPDGQTRLPFSNQIIRGTYAPTNFSGANLPPPCPPGPYSTDLTTLFGTNANGTWSLFVNDIFGTNGGTIAGGWSIAFNDTERQPALVSTAFTYQGRLDGVPPDATVNLRFRLWNHPTSTDPANTASDTITRTVTLNDNLFTTTIDFGTGIERQRALFVEIAASVPGSGGSLTTLAPRQPITGTPLALGVRGITIDSQSQVGVGGIDNPDFTFESNGRIRIRGSADGSGDPPGIWFSSPNPVGAQINRGFIGQVDDSNLGLRAGGTFHLLVNSNGNVAIGDPSGSPPPERLTVNGGIQMNTGNRLAFGTLGDLAGTAENTDAIFFQRVGPAPNISVLRLNVGDDPATGSNDAFVITTTVANGAAFTERFRFGVDGNAFKPGGGSWSVLSDAAAKDNLTPLSGTLDRLMRLHGYAFTYKPEFVADGRALPGTQIGLVAQEVQEVFPDWVATTPDGTLFVSERATTALMVEALRDLRAEKDAVAAKADAAQRAIAELRADVAKRDAEAAANHQEIVELRARLERLERALESRRSGE